MVYAVTHVDGYGRGLRWSGRRSGAGGERSTGGLEDEKGNGYRQFHCTRNCQYEHDLLPEALL